MNSIRARLLVVMVLLVTLSLGILSVINYLKSKEILMREIEATMSEKSGDKAGEISAWFAERQAELKVIARSPVVIAGNEDAIIAYLNEEIKKNPVYNNFLYFDVNGNAVAANRARSSVGDRDYVKQVVAGGKASFVNDPYVARTTGKTVTTVSAPILRDGKIVGGIGGSVELDTVIKMVSDIKLGKTGYGFMLQGDGLRLHVNAELGALLDIASIVAEAASWGDKSLTATGLGSYIAAATADGDFPRVVLGIVVMSLFVTLTNRLVWRPLYGFAERRLRIA